MILAQSPYGVATCLTESIIIKASKKGSDMKSFNQIIAEMQNGDVEAEFTEELNDLIQKVQNSGKPGTLTIKLKLKLNGDRMMSISHSISASDPKPEKGDSLFFINDNLELQRNDPQQLSIPLKAVHSSSMVHHNTGTDD